MSDLQRDISEIDFLVAEFAGIEITAAWQRIRARLTPNRERVARGVAALIEEWDEWAAENQGTRECFEASLIAAIDAMKETP